MGSIKHLATIQHGKNCSYAFSVGVLPPLFDIFLGMLRSRPLLIVSLEDVHNFLQILYPSKVSFLPANREGLVYCEW